MRKLLNIAIIGDRNCIIPGSAHGKCGQHVPSNRPKRSGRERMPGGGWESGAPGHRSPEAQTTASGDAVCIADVGGRMGGPGLLPCAHRRFAEGGGASRRRAGLKDRKDRGLRWCEQALIARIGARGRSRQIDGHEREPRLSGGGAVEGHDMLMPDGAGPELEALLIRG